MMGRSRDSFYRFKETVRQRRELARKKPVLKNRVPAEICRYTSLRKG